MGEGEGKGEGEGGREGERLERDNNIEMKTDRAEINSVSVRDEDKGRNRDKR